MIDQNLLAGLAEPGAVLLQARQNGHVAVIHHRPAMAADVARASGIRPAALRRRHRDHQKQWNNEKNSGHLAMPAGHEPKGVLVRANRHRNAYCAAPF